LDQVIRRARGARHIMDIRDGLTLVVNRGPERVARIAKRVVGKRKVTISFFVKR